MHRTNNPDWIDDALAANAALREALDEIRRRLADHHPRAKPNTIRAGATSHARRKAQATAANGPMAAVVVAAHR